MTNEDYSEMTDDELAELGLSDEKLAEIHQENGIKSIKLGLEMNERCYRKFGKSILSDAQIAIFQKMAKGIFPTDDEMEILNNEQITLDMQAVKQERQNDIQTAAKLGENYQPELLTVDKTSFCIN